MNKPPYVPLAGNPRPPHSKTHSKNTVIVTRHRSLIAWLRQRGITGQVLPRARAADVAGKHVIGVLPLHLAALAETISTVDMPDLPDDLVGRELTVEQMDAAGARLQAYVVRPVRDGGHA